MNTPHLGDAYDLAKKVILETLKAELNKKMYALPMLTDTFNEEQLAFYRNLTSCDEIKTEKIPTNPADRTRYFETEKSDGIIFVDPNTGIKQEKISGRKLSAKEKVNYISFDELRTISEQCDLLVVYDESFSNATATEKVREVQRKIARIEQTGIHCFYLNMNKQLCFAFISKNKDLLQQAKALLIERNVALPERIVE
ncbi:MAG: hypothetical protein ACK4XM_09835 [Chloroherpetonaceae bacterium]